jgi:hypothetical protein
MLYIVRTAESSNQGRSYLLVIGGAQSKKEVIYNPPIFTTNKSKESCNHEGEKKKKEQSELGNSIRQHANTSEDNLRERFEFKFALSKRSK